MTSGTGQGDTYEKGQQFSDSLARRGGPGTAAKGLEIARERAARTLTRIACRYARPGTEAELPLPLTTGEDGDPVTNTGGPEYRRWERGIERALDDMDKERYSKVVLARTARLRFAVPLSPPDVLARFRGHYGFLFCLQPDASTAFLGCTPERLFLSKGSTVVTEALAGTRGRGDTKEEDERLGEELMGSEKVGDIRENAITADYVSAALRRAGAVELDCSEPCLKRLTHVQHICRLVDATDATLTFRRGYTFHGENEEKASPSTTLPITEMHPTAAVCGKPRDVTYSVIGEVEGFDRGFYAGPVGYVSAGASEFGVAIRSALVTTSRTSSEGLSRTSVAAGASGVAGFVGGCGGERGGGGSEMTLFAGAGIVPGSVALSEWAETGVKMKNFLSLFPVKPARSLRQLPNVNSLWGTLVVEELVRLGVRHFCVCPGSRSAPLAVAIARHPSAVSISHHDERGAGFYAVGFARAGRGRGGGGAYSSPSSGAGGGGGQGSGVLGMCAVVTSSGTAVANLLPAAAEADAAGLAMLLLTADRPPELRGCGSNQTIDQVNLFGSRSRLSLDIQCPTDDISAACLLSDIDHAVSRASGGGGGVGSGIPGPVHLNFMFRENLAPVDGAIRDASVSGLSSEWSERCLDSPRITRWEACIEPFTTTVGGRERGGKGGRGEQDLQQVVDRLLCARRGLLVVGATTGPEERADVRHLATTLRWPVYADVTSGLRRWSTRVGLGLGRLDQLLQDDAIKEAFAPDAILQVGSPLISKRVQKFISEPAATLTAPISVICSPLGGWHDPGRGFTTRLGCSTRALAAAVDRADASSSVARCGSELEALVKVSCTVERAQTRAIAGAAATARLEDTPESISPPPSRSRLRSSLSSAAAEPTITTVTAGAVPNDFVTGEEDDCSGRDGSSEHQPSRHEGAGDSGEDGVPGTSNGSNRGRMRRPTPLKRQQGQQPQPRPPKQEDQEPLTEPFVAWCVSHEIDSAAGLFLSSSMPCRDMDAYADSGAADGVVDGYGRGERPIDGRAKEGNNVLGGGGRLSDVASNRGASGIDGVISSAMGYATGLRAPVTLMIGDMATLHDLGSLHALKELDEVCCPVTVVCVNNGGGGIFSFLPIADARHGDAFSPLFDTPHSTNFEGLCCSMGLKYRRATTKEEFRTAFLESQGIISVSKHVFEIVCKTRRHFFIEAVTSREENVPVHRLLGGIGKAAALEHLLRGVRLGWDFTPAPPVVEREHPSSTLRISNSHPGDGRPTKLRGEGVEGRKPTLLLLHGFMGSKEDWKGEFTKLASAEGHAILAVELPGHGISGGRPHGSGDTCSESSAMRGCGPSRNGGGDDSCRAFKCEGRGGRDGTAAGSSLPAAAKSVAETAAAITPNGDGEERRRGLGGSESKYSGANYEGNGRSMSSGDESDGSGDRGEGFPCWGVGGVYLSAEAVGAVCDAVGAGPYVVVGYSMGGRVALALASRRPWVVERGGGLVLVSSSPGFTSNAARVSRWASDLSLATRIAALGRLAADSREVDGKGGDGDREKEARAFLHGWYAAPLWGNMQHRRPAAYSAMIDRRLTNLGFSIDASHGTTKDGNNGSSNIGSSNSACGVGPRRDGADSGGSSHGGREEQARNGSEEGLARDGTSTASGGGGGSGGEYRGTKSSPWTGGGGRGFVGSRAKSLARSCLALSAARQANLWPVLRELSERNANTQEEGSAIVPVVYVAGELDSRYGGGCRSSTPVPSPVTTAAPEITPRASSTRRFSSEQSRSASPVGQGAAGAAGASTKNSKGKTPCTPSASAAGDTGHARPRAVVATCGPTAEAAVAGTKTVAGAIAAKFPGVGVAILPGCGHAVPTEAPSALFREVAKLSAAACAASASTSDPASTPSSSSPSCASESCATPGTAAARKDRSSGAKIVAFSLEEFSLQMTSPLQLSLCRLTERRGVLVRLEGRLPHTSGTAAGGQAGGCRVWGVGEVTPLPGFHKETLDEAIAQLRAVMPLLVGRTTSIGLAALGSADGNGNFDDFDDFDESRLGGGCNLDSWLKGALGGTEEDSLRGLDPRTTSPASSTTTTTSMATTGAEMPQISAYTTPTRPTLLPSVRCGIEMALVHLAARGAGVSIGAAISTMSGLPCRGAIEVNSLAARGEGSENPRTEGTPRVLKVKVGGKAGPSEDAARTLELLRQCTSPKRGLRHKSSSSSSSGRTLRLDANQAWEMEEALQFSTALTAAEVKQRNRGSGSNSTKGGGICGEQGFSESGREAGSVDLGMVEYIEEPLQNPRSLEQFWERSGKRVPYALDESLGMGREAFTDEELLQLRGCAAFVLKASVVGGLSRTARLCRLARRLGAKAVLSSAFESGVGLAHASILASCFATQGVAHGLSTYSRLRADVVAPGFSATVSNGTVDVMAAEELLNRIAEQHGQRGTFSSKRL
ncbi:unnamed protein product [Scytosiphon promiscuus]